MPEETPDAGSAPRPRGILVDLALLSVILIWGMNFSIMKGLYTWFDPLAFTALRFAVSVMTLVAVMKLAGYPLRVEREDMRAFWGLGILTTAAYQVLFVIGLDNTRAGNAGLLMSSTPVFAYLTGLLLKRERFEKGTLGGILLSMAGVAAIVVFGPAEIRFGGQWLGDAMILAAAFCWGWYTGSSPRLIARYGALRVTLWVMITGTAVLLPPLVPFALRQDWAAVPALAWAGFGYSTFLSIVYSYIAWSWAIRHLGVSRTAVYSNVTPLVALMGGWVLLGETPAWSQLAGAPMILLGVFIVRRPKKRARV